MNEEEKAWDMYAAAVIAGMCANPRCMNSDQCRTDKFHRPLPDAWILDAAASAADEFLKRRRERFPSDTEGGDT